MLDVLKIHSMTSLQILRSEHSQAEEKVMYF